MTERQTEVGAIPEGWIIVNLEEITTKIGDGIHATPNYSNNGEYYFINGNNIRDGRIIITEETKNVDISEFKRYRKDLGESTVLLSINGTIGNLALYRGEPVILGKSVAYLNIRDQIEKTYLHHALQTDLVANQFNDGITGTTINNLGLGTIRNTQIALPPLPEQRAIATALSDADGLIGALDALIEKKRAIKQAAMQQLLTGKKRLPGFEGKWETKRLGEVASIRNQKVLPSNVDPDTLCVELEHIGQGDGRLLEVSIAQNSTSSKYRFFTGDVLFGRLRSYLRKFWHADRDGICTTEIWPLMVDESRLVSGFLYSTVQSNRFIEAASISYGTHMPRADWNVMKNFEIHLPPLPEQTAIAAVLSDMDAEIAALERRREKAEQIKQGMMQQLLTGRIRLVEPPEAAA